jgi:hypothetical protein
MSFGPERCPRCGGTKFKRDGIQKSGNQRWRCKTCYKSVTPSEYNKKHRVETKEEIYRDFKQDSGFITTKSLSIRTLEQALEASEVDLDEWEVDRYITNSWEVTMGTKASQTGKPETYTNYQVKIWLKRKVEGFNLEEFKTELLSDVIELSASVKPYKFKKLTGDSHLLMISLNDLHLGRMVWGKECGRDYDVRVAQKNFHNSLDHFLSYTSPFSVEQILFLVGNDLFNYDYASPFPHTERGTPQESDGRWQKLFRIGRLLVTDAVSKLSTVAPIKIMVIPGNHDPQTIFYLGELLEVFYSGNANVDVDNSPPRRKYHRYGENLIGVTHGLSEKPNHLQAIMSFEAKEDWGKTKYWYFYIGHLHHEATDIKRVGEKFQGLRMPKEISEDYKGLIIDYLPNMAFHDDYETGLGFVGTIKAAKATIHHPSKGRVATFNYNT